jgi:hypothetical protein
MGGPGLGDWYPGNDNHWHYDELAPTPGEAPPVTSMLPAVRPTPYPRTDGENDHLVEATFNGLRPDDLALRQPPQSPEWIP